MGVVAESPSTGTVCFLSIVQGDVGMLLVLIPFVLGADRAGVEGGES